MRFSLSLVMAFVLLIPSIAAAEQLKSFAFQNSASHEWSRLETYGVGGRQRLGLFNNLKKYFPPSVSLTIKNAPDMDQATLQFDLVLVGNWESEGSQADRFVVSSGETVLLEMTSFPCRIENDDETKALGNDGYVKVKRRKKLGYWIVPVSVQLPLSTLQKPVTIDFKGYLTGKRTEFWALDNVHLKRN